MIMAEEKISVNYTDDNIRTMEGVEHIRKRPGMYIGRLGNGDDQGDGIYVLLKEVVDNSIDEFSMGFGKQIQINVTEKEAVVRDFQGLQEVRWSERCRSEGCKRIVRILLCGGLQGRHELFCGIPSWKARGLRPETYKGKERHHGEVRS